MYEKEALYKEKSAMRQYLLNHWKVPGPMGQSTESKMKDSENSIKLRKYGNNFYNTKMTDERTHENVWRFYTQSIALAPNGSSELALGYGNRSALLFHLQKYEDSIKDCYRAIEITTCEFLKCKLMCRKAECLALLNKTSAKKICDDALKKLSELTIKEDLKNQFLDKIHKTLNTLKTSNSSKQINKPSDDLSELVDMKYQKEAPYASKSVKINYSKEWGRHVTATKDIKPGDIVAIPDNFCTLLTHQGIYLFCSNCVQPAWSPIPCKQCIFDVYCSEECMAKAWDKYHKYECGIVYPYMFDAEELIWSFTNSQMAFRLLLIMIHNAGGIEQLKKIVNDMEHCKDLRTKGFSSDGIFHSDHPRSMFSNMCGPDTLIEPLQIQEAAAHLYLLVARTDLFGKKTDVITSDLLVMDDMLFVGALLTRIDSVFRKQLFVLAHLFGKGKEEKVQQYAISFNAFNSLLNHSCDPNIKCRGRGTHASRHEVAVKRRRARHYIQCIG